eukprot:scaffold1172_cov144-Skeletonema_menzelii.AAC.13
MMQPAEDNNDDDDIIFVYMGGDQQVPHGVRRARIHKSVKIIPARAFYNRWQLIYVEFHDGIEMIEKEAFGGCESLRSVKLLGVKIIKKWAFLCCNDLTDVEFGDKLEIIEGRAFDYCISLTDITMPHVRTIGPGAFMDCYELTDLQLPEGLETLRNIAFKDCRRLRRIAMPLKIDMIEFDAFNGCSNLTTVNLVGGVHKSVASLHLESWRNEMRDEINLINRDLPQTSFLRKTEAIQRWIRSLIQRLVYFKAEHRALLKEAATLLELALWKANLDHNEGGVLEREGVRTTRRQQKKARKEVCITSGASIVIKNVLPFLQLE